MRRYETWSLARATRRTPARWERTPEGWREAGRGWSVSVQRVSIQHVHPPDAWSAYAAAGVWEERLAVRARRPGDRMRILGGGGTHKLKDLFIEARIPLEERALWPVVECAEGILWVPGIARSDLHLLPAQGGAAVCLTALGSLKR